MNFGEYTRLPGVNWSSLKHLRRSALHFQYAQEVEDEESKAMRLGGSTHCSILEPDEFPRRYVLLPTEPDRSLNRATKEGKARWAAWLEAHPGDEGLDADAYKLAVFRDANPGKTPLSAGDYDNAIAMRNAVRQHPVAGPLLLKGEAEQVLQWRDALGLECKGRIDWRRNRAAFVDLKTARLIDQYRFAAAAWALGYFHQLAFYRRGIAKLERCSREMVTAQIIAVENTPPFDVAVYEPDAESLEKADAEIDELLARLVLCRETNEWPGAHVGGVEPLRAPVYALDDDYEFEVKEVSNG